MKKDEDEIDIDETTIKEKETETIYFADLMPESKEIKNENDIKELLKVIDHKLRKYLDEDKDIKLM